jgi:hypothetical protein
MRIFYRVMFLASIVALGMSAVRPAHSASAEITLTGTMSCARCQGIQPMHKGYTQFSWALQSVSEGDDIVLVTQNKVYKLQGDKDQLLKFMSAKVTVTGLVDGTTMDVARIGRAAKGE